MAESLRLDQLYHVAERFRRSVNIAADYTEASPLEGYVITPLTKSILLRISEGLGERSTQRSWSVTGPYGAGKSACMLLLSQLLAYPPREAARSWARTREPELYRQLLRDSPGLAKGGFVVMPMVGSRQPLSTTLLSGLLRTLESVQLSTPKVRECTREVRALHEQILGGQDIAPTRVTEIVRDSAQAFQAGDASICGLLLIFDELGKALEYAAIHPEHGDIELLQILAEMASRSQLPVIGLVTVLHQAFEQYAATLSPMQQREWSKVQGRFEDLGFLESQGELLNLVGEAITPSTPMPDLERAIRREAEQAAELGILPREVAQQDAQRALVGCAPREGCCATAWLTGRSPGRRSTRHWNAWKDGTWFSTVASRTPMACGRAATWTWMRALSGGWPAWTAR